MNEEEKDLLDFLYRLIEQGTHKIYDNDLNDRKICEYINLIEKQQKELESADHLASVEFIKKHFISKQVIRDKIKYLDNQQKQWLEDRELKASDKEIIFAREFLKELLESE